MENANLLLSTPELDASCREDFLLLGVRIRSLGLVTGLLSGLARPGLVVCAGLEHSLSSPLLLIVLSLCPVVCKLHNLQIQREVKN